MTKEIAERFAHEMWDKKDVSNIDRFVDSSAVIHSTLGNFRGPKDMETIVKAWVKGFPDLKVENLTTFQNDDKVAIQWRARGTHLGEFKGLAPTAKTVSYNGVTIYRIINDKIVEYWAYVDMQNVMNQLK